MSQSSDINLDPQLQALVDAGVKANPSPPHLADVPVAAARAGYVTISQMNSHQGIECQTVEDLAIPTRGGSIPARKYVKDNADAAMAGLVYIHGGGFTIGDLATHDSLCRQLARDAGVMVIALDYRLGPEHRFPAAAEDCIDATEWLLTHAAELGLDSQRIAIGGDSAGGNLSAVTCNHLADAGGLQPTLQVLIYPATDLLAADTQSRKDLASGVTLDSRLIEYFNECYFGDEPVDPMDSRLAPARHAISNKTPPAHIITAQYDPLRDEGEDYHNKLLEAGVQSTYHCYPGLMHNFVLQTGVVAAADQAVKDIAAILRDKLKS